VIEGCEPDYCVVVDSCLEKIDPKRLKWRTRPFVAPESIWEDDKTFDVGDIKTTVEFFYTFFDTQLIHLMARQTDIYSLQEHCIELKCTDEEIKRYMGILLYLGVLKLPQLRMAWSKDL